MVRSAAEADLHRPHEPQTEGGSQSAANGDAAPAARGPAAPAAAAAPASPSATRALGAPAAAGQAFAPSPYVTDFEAAFLSETAGE